MNSVKRRRNLTRWLVWLLLLPTVTHGFSAYSNAELDQLERDFIQEINHSDAVLRDPLANDYINHVAKRLAEHSDLNSPHFFIVKSREINAFAGPGGHIGVNTQLILESETESELAGVMAHEIAHVRQHHLYRMIEHQKQMRVPMLASLLASIALGVINPVLSTGLLYGSLSGFAQDSINYVRSGEKEADSIGIDMLTKSGFDPHGMVGFFKKMQQNSRYHYSENIPAILRTHPLDEERIAEAESRCPVTRQSVTSDQHNYLLFKELIRNEISIDPKQSLDYYRHKCSQKTSETACQYGYALRLMQANQYGQAMTHIKPLWTKEPNNLYYAVAMAQCHEGLAEHTNAVQILSELHANFPDSYAVTVEYGKALIAANQAQKAASILLTANRKFKADLQICNQLARAQAANHTLGYAYFTLAECHILQGERHDALRKLKIAKTFAKKDHLLDARIAARIDDITLKE